MSLEIDHIASPRQFPTTKAHVLPISLLNHPTVTEAPVEIAR